MWNISYIKDTISVRFSQCKVQDLDFFTQIWSQLFLQSLWSLWCAVKTGHILVILAQIRAAHWRYILQGSVLHLCVSFLPDRPQRSGAIMDTLTCQMWCNPPTPPLIQPLTLPLGKTLFMT